MQVVRSPCPYYASQLTRFSLMAFSVPVAGRGGLATTKPAYVRRSREVLSCDGSFQEKGRVKCGSASRAEAVRAATRPVTNPAALGVLLTLAQVLPLEKY